MKRRWALAAAIAATTALLAGECSAATQYTIRGAGNDSCGSWMQARADRYFEALNLEAWVLGYVTAFDRETWAPENDRPLSNTDNAGLFAFVDQYCRTHPLDNLVRAAGSLVDSLAARLPR